MDIVKGHRCARSKANISELGAGRKYALVPNKALSIGPLGGYYALLADTKVNQTLGPDIDNAMLAEAPLKNCVQEGNIEQLYRLIARWVEPLMIL